MGKFRTIEISDPLLESESDELRFVTAKGEALRGRADVTLYVPEDLEEPANAPVVILLHGLYGSQWAWAVKGRAHRTARDQRRCASSLGYSAFN